MSDSTLVSSIVTILQQGGVVALPTETIYGLCCDPRSEQALSRLFAIKARDISKTVLCLTGERTQIDTLVAIPPFLEPVLAHFWPGPLTVVFSIQEKQRLSPLIRKDGTIALRHTSDPLLQKVTASFGYPIVATSAGLSGKPFLNTAAEIRTQLGNSLDLIVDTDHELLQTPSTIIKCEEDGTLSLIREGALSWIEVQRALL